MTLQHTQPDSAQLTPPWNHPAPHYLRSACHAPAGRPPPSVPRQRHTGGRRGTGRGQQHVPRRRPRAGARTRWACSGLLLPTCWLWVLSRGLLPAGSLLPAATCLPGYARRQGHAGGPRQVWGRRPRGRRRRRRTQRLAGEGQQTASSCSNLQLQQQGRTWLGRRLRGCVRCVHRKQAQLVLPVTPA